MGNLADKHSVSLAPVVAMMAAASSDMLRRLESCLLLKAAGHRLQLAPGSLLGWQRDGDDGAMAAAEVVGSYAKLLAEQHRALFAMCGLPDLHAEASP